MVREKKIALVVVASLAMSFFAFAEEDGYVRLKKTNSYNTGFAGATWDTEVEAEDVKNRDYLVAGCTYYTLSNERIDARSLTIGDLEGKAGDYFAYYGAHYSGSGGLILAKGTLHVNATTIKIGGKITVTSPKSEPFIFYSGKNKKETLTFTNDVHAASDCGIIVHSGGYVQGKHPFELKFSGDACDFLGEVVVTSQYDSAGAPLTAEFSLAGEATYFGGSIIVKKDAVFNANVDTSVDSLTLERGAILNLSAVSSFEVRGNLTIDDGAVINMKDGVKLNVGSITLKNGADFDLSLISGFEVQDFALEEGSILYMRLGNALTVGETLSLPQSPFTINLSGTPKSVVSEVTRYALITMPANYDYPIDNFIIEDDSTSFYTKTKLEFILAEDGKTKTLYASYFPVVHNILDNKADHNDPNSESAELYGKYWDDGHPVHSGAHYSLKKLNDRTTYFTTRFAPHEALQFDGESLFFDTYVSMRLRIGDFTVPYMIFSSSGIIGLTGCVHVIRSKFEVNGSMVVEPRRGGSITLAGPVTGKESSKMRFRGESASTSVCRGTVELDGDNTGYPGKINVTLEHPEKLAFNSQFTSLIARRADNLGGARTVFAYDALQIDNGSRLEALDSFELSEPTRGVFVSWIGRILVAEEKELAIKQQLTVNGRFYKEGAGTLALGGDLRFLEFETNFVESVDKNGLPIVVTNIISTVVENIPDDPANRTFYVTGGKVKPLSAHALDGLDVVFSNKTSKLDVGLVLDMNSEDETLRAKGICNVKSPAPLAFLDDDAQKKVPLYLEWDNIPQADEYSFNVMTVKADCADVFNKLNIVLPQSLSHLKLTTTRNVDTVTGSVTLSAKLKKYGFTISIR